MRSSIVCVFVDVANLLGLGFPSSTLCMAGFVASYWFKSGFVKEYLVLSFYGN